jgi:hypothetical protein
MQDGSQSAPVSVLWSRVRSGEFLSRLQYTLEQQSASSQNAATHGAATAASTEAKGPVTRVIHAVSVPAFTDAEAMIAGKSPGLLLMLSNSCFSASQAMFHNPASSQMRRNAADVVARPELDVTNYQAILKARETVESQMMAISHQLSFLLKFFDILEAERVRFNNLLFNLEAGANSVSAAQTTAADPNSMVVDDSAK